MNFSSTEELFLASEINTLLQKGVVEEGELISPIFHVSKFEDCFKMILNLKKAK